MTRAYHLAVLNIAMPLYGLEDPLMADFVGNLDRVNQIARNHPGYIWHMDDDNLPDAYEQLKAAFGESVISNLSVWDSAESLRHFMFDTFHNDVMRRRKAWFHHMKERYVVLWWVEAGQNPTEAEAIEKLKRIREIGPSAEAFSLGKVFAQPEHEREAC